MAYESPNPLINELESVVTETALLKFEFNGKVGNKSLAICNSVVEGFINSESGSDQL